MKVLIDMPVYESALSSLQRMSGIELHVIEEPAEKVRPLPVELIQDCEILFCTFPPENYLEMRSLKLIQISSAGYKQLIGQGFDTRGIQACNALGVFDIPIAEWNIAMMVNLARDFRKMSHNQASQTWDRSPRFQHEIRGSVVGIWGYGGIGRETARLSKALGLRVHVLSRSAIKPRENIYSVPGTGDPEGVLPDRVFSPVKKREFLEGLDFLIMAIPQTPDTEGLLGEAELRMLPRHAFLLNPARGPLIQEQPLIQALQEGWISGAALDTHYYYPLPSDHPLWKLPNVILTPHISGSSASPRFLERVWDIFMQNVHRIKRGEPLLNVLPPSELRDSHVPVHAR